MQNDEYEEFRTNSWRQAQEEWQPYEDVLAQARKKYWVAFQLQLEEARVWFDTQIQPETDAHTLAVDRACEAHRERIDQYREEHELGKLEYRYRRA